MDPEYSNEERQVKALEDIAESLNAIAYEFEWSSGWTDSEAAVRDELLAALKSLVALNDANGFHTELWPTWIEKAREAIAKAEGVVTKPNPTKDGL